VQLLDQVEPSCGRIAHTSNLRWILQGKGIVAAPTHEPSALSTDPAQALEREFGSR
jgi:hypothetical protein